MHLPSIMTSISMQLAIEKNEGAHSHTFKLAYHNFPILKFGGFVNLMMVHVATVSSIHICMYMTKTGKKSLMIQNKQVLLNNSV